MMRQVVCWRRLLRRLLLLLLLRMWRMLRVNTRMRILIMPGNESCSMNCNPRTLMIVGLHVPALPQQQETEEERVVCVLLPPRITRRRLLIYYQLLVFVVRYRPTARRHRQVLLLRPSSLFLHPYLPGIWSVAGVRHKPCAPHGRSGGVVSKIPRRRAMPGWILIVRRNFVANVRGSSMPTRVRKLVVRAVTCVIHVSSNNRRTVIRTIPYSIPPAPPRGLHHNYAP